LSAEDIKQGLTLSLRLFAGQRNVKIGASQVAVPLWDLVLQNQLTPEGVPGEVRHDAVILVPVIARVGEYNVRCELARDSLERVFNGRKIGGEVPITKSMESHRIIRGGPEKFLSSASSLARSRIGGAPDDPSKFVTRGRLRQLGNRGSATYLDVIRVRAEAQDPKRSGTLLQAQPDQRLFLCVRGPDRVGDASDGVVRVCRWVGCQSTRANRDASSNASAARRTVEKGMRARSAMSSNE
jgi:hypothetical protein